MKTGTAFFAGVIGAAIMTILAAIGRALGVGLNLEMLVGSLFTVNLGVGTWILGLAVHLVVSGLLGLVYALFFEFMFHHANARLGVLLAIPHTVLAGWLMGRLYMLHPLIPDRLAEPGIFMVDRGVWAVILFLAAHLVYGAIVGALYRPVRHPPARAA